MPILHLKQQQQRRLYVRNTQQMTDSNFRRNLEPVRFWRLNLQQLLQKPVEMRNTNVRLEKKAGRVMVNTSIP